MSRLLGFLDAPTCLFIMFMTLLVWGLEYGIRLMAYDWWAEGQAVCSTPVFGETSEHQLTLLLTCGKIQAHTSDVKAFKDWSKGQTKFDCVIYRSGVARCK